MRVFNLTDQRVDYRGKLIPPYGSDEFDIDFIPDRDRALEKAKMLAFGALPKGWKRPQPKVVIASPLEQAGKMVAEFVKEELSRPGIDKQLLSEVNVEEKVDINIKKKKF